MLTGRIGGRSLCSARSLCTLGALMLLCTAGGARAQHSHGTPSGWRMPPMPPSMRPLPGYEDSLPALTPFLPTASPHAGSVPLAVPRRVMRVTNGDTITLTAGLVRRQLAGRSVLMYAFNGQYPGPLIWTSQHSTIYVRLVNELRQPTAVHWHGVRIENRFDGVPGLTQQPVEPGESFLYRITLPDAGLYWYHPHVRSDIQQDLGLAGNIVSEPAASSSGSIADREEVVILDDILLDEHGILPYGLEAANHALAGRFGNVLLANGDPDLRLHADAGEVVRFYLTNAASARTFNVSFGDARMKLIGSGMGRFEHEEWTSSVVLAPAQRYVVDVRFGSPGVVPLVNRVQAIDPVRGEFVAEVDTMALIYVAAGGVVSEAARAFDELRPDTAVIAEMKRYRPYRARPPDHELVLAFDPARLSPLLQHLMSLDTVYVPPVEWSDFMPDMNWLTTSSQLRWVLRDAATGREDEEIDWGFQAGDLVKVRLVNERHSLHAMQHPIHVHGQRFVVLDRDGLPNDNMVWRDTVLVPAGSVIDILLDASNPGKWMLHCHIAEHLEAGMHMVFTVTPSG